MSPSRIVPGPFASSKRTVRPSRVLNSYTWCRVVLTEVSPPPLVVAYDRRQRASAVSPLLHARFSSSERRITLTAMKIATVMISPGTT